MKGSERGPGFSVVSQFEFFEPLARNAAAIKLRAIPSSAKSVAGPASTYSSLVTYHAEQVGQFNVHEIG